MDMEPTAREFVELLQKLQLQGLLPVDSLASLIEVCSLGDDALEGVATMETNHPGLLRDTYSIDQKTAVFLAAWLWKKFPGASKHRRRFPIPQPVPVGRPADQPWPDHLDDPYFPQPRDDPHFFAKITAGEVTQLLQHPGANPTVVAPNRHDVPDLRTFLPTAAEPENAYLLGEASTDLSLLRAVIGRLADCMDALVKHLNLNALKASPSLLLSSPPPLSHHILAMRQLLASRGTTSTPLPIPSTPPPSPSLQLPPPGKRLNWPRGCPPAGLEEVPLHPSVALGFVAFPSPGDPAGEETVRSEFDELAREAGLGRYLDNDRLFVFFPRHL
ncbi:hypothetical protein PAPYR_10529 [Paratrimastix pyriformis]|uniref:Uncharacterized protein n=1 Tax=Paratrimastix pyriformis TaxID=342808 RepID=A0ABQ8UBJ2_9EUKA|nr:hypothetical protein PAPYR_10529 [Paratrimastix pyriformis]